MSDKDLPAVGGFHDLEIPEGFADDAGKGNEEQTTQDMSIPYLGILQKSSPQLDDVEGAAPGLFIDSVSNELYKEPLFINCHFQSRHVEWILRDNGGGFVKAHLPGQAPEIVGQGPKNEDLTADGTQIVRTHYHFGFVYSPEDEVKHAEPVVLSLSSTQMKYSAQWNTKISKYLMGEDTQAPRWWMIWALATDQRENAKGRWWTISTNPHHRLLTEDNGPDMWIKCRELAEATSTLDVKPPENSSPVGEDGIPF